MTSDKNSLRAKCLKAREQIDVHAANAAALMLREHLLDAVPVSASVVAVYLPIRGEIDLAGALPELIERGHTLCLPVTVEKNAPLVFREWMLGETLAKDAYGMGVPPADRAEIVPDAVIVPLVAFDAKGYRLGYGAGYYDRSLQELRAQKKAFTAIGAAFASQQVPFIPSEDHDERLDMVVTEKGIMRF